MSVSTEVHRTLVKSPPELWTELSNPEALARHLGNFGEIRITKTDPETKVEWEAEEASGVVQLKQSGWGTKVTLSVTRTPAISKPSSAPAPDPVAVEREPETMAVELKPDIAQPEPESAAPAEPQPTNVSESKAEPAPAAEVEPIAAESAELEPVITEPEPELSPATPKPESVAPAESVAPVEPESVALVGPESVAPVAPDLDPYSTDSAPRPGFFARLFGKRKAKPVAIEPEPVAPVEPESVAPAEPDATPEPEPQTELVALAAPEPVYPDPPAQPQAPEPAEDLASELESLEEQLATDTAELLTGVLDRLGAAHHRPFSRG
jgi:hypothetical protein